MFVYRPSEDREKERKRERYLKEIVFNDLLEAVGRPVVTAPGYRPTCKTRATRVTHRVKRVPPVTSYLAVVQPAPRSPGKIGSASIDHASRWDLGRSSWALRSIRVLMERLVFMWTAFGASAGRCLRIRFSFSFSSYLASLFLSLSLSLSFSLSLSRPLLLVLAALGLSLCTHSCSPSLPLSCIPSVSLPSSTTFRSVYPSSGPRR